MTVTLLTRDGGYSLISGESGLGKSTLINSLFLTDLYTDRKFPKAAGETLDSQIPNSTQENLVLLPARNDTGYYYTTNLCCSDQGQRQGQPTRLLHCRSNIL